MPVDDLLKWRNLTDTVNDADSPNSFVKRTYFSREEAKTTKKIDVPRIDRGRRMAPLIKRGTAATMIEGGDEDMSTITPAHIRVKRAFTPSELLEKRRPGSRIYAEDAEMTAAMQEYVARELGYGLDDVDDTEEYLCCQLLTGQIDYTDPSGYRFTATVPRKAAMSITLAGADLWDASTANIVGNFLTAQELVSDEISTTVDSVVLGREAAQAFANAVLGGAVQMNPLLDLRRIASGQIDFTTQIDNDTGALRLGTLSNGIEVWRYGRQILHPDGSTVDLIRPKYAEFIPKNSSRAGADRVIYYGAIEDMKAIEGSGRIASKRFSKSWEIEDPSSTQYLIESNPLPVMRRPNSWVSMQVVA